MLLYPFFEFVHDLSPPVPIPPPSRTSFSLGTRHGAQTISPYHVRSHTSSSRFYCHGDGEPVGPGENASPPCLVPKGRHVSPILDHHGWIHWFTYPVPHGGHLNIDYWPDTSQYSREELFVAPGFKHKDGSPAHLFSS